MEIREIGGCWSGLCNSTEQRRCGRQTDREFNIFFSSLDVLCPVFCITKRKWIYFSMEKNSFFSPIKAEDKEMMQD